MFQKIRSRLALVLILAALYQAIFQFDEKNNLLCTAIALTTSLTMYQLFLRQRLFQRHTLSTMSVLTFVFAYMSLPLIVSAFEGRAVTRNLELPAMTFLLHTAAIASLAVAHWVYQASTPFMRFREFLTWRIYPKLGLMKAPSYLQLWIMGFIGLMAMFYAALSLSAKGANLDSGILDKVTVSLTMFAYAPFLIPLARMFQRIPPPFAPQIVLQITGYFGLILGVAILRNDRSEFAMGIVILLISAMVGYLIERVKIKRVSATYILLGLLFMVVGIPLLSNLATVMVAVRSQYGKQGARADASLTLDALANQDAVLAGYNPTDKSPDALWNEAYYDPSNVFLSRFANVRYLDNTLELGQDLNDGQLSLLINFTIGDGLSALPGPLLTAIGMNVDKGEYRTASVSDYLYYLQTGGGLGSFRAGSFIGHGYIIFGLFYFPLFAVVMLVYFMVIDGFVYTLRVKLTAAQQEELGLKQRVVQTAPLIMPYALLTSYDLINPYVKGTINHIPQYMIRAIPQDLIVYAFVFYFTSRAAFWVSEITPQRAIDTTDPMRV